MSLDKWTMYIDGQPFNAAISKMQLEVIEENQSNNVASIMKSLKKPICMEFTYGSIKKYKTLTNIYNRIKKKLAKKINDLLAKLKK